MTDLRLVAEQVTHLIPIGREPHLGDARLAAGLREMLDRATHPFWRDALAVDAEDVAAIRGGLQARPKRARREQALLALAKWHEDWTGTEQGRTEMRTFLAYIAPACTEALWAEICGDLATANDEQYNVEARAAAEQNLFVNLAAALDGPGPEAA